MADEADVANDHLQKITDAAIASINTTIPINLTGECIWCGEAVPDDRRWCSADCRDADIARNRK